ncbi:MAG: AAA family ATPase [Faecalibacillus faecis]
MKHFNINNYLSPFIYGPTSCGKTLTAKSLAKYLNYHYLKLDMNQYQESHSLYKLLETYHEQPSLLLSTLQSYPHTVLLLMLLIKHVKKLFIYFHKS